MTKFVSVHCHAIILQKRMATSVLFIWNGPWPDITPEQGGENAERQRLKLCHNLKIYEFPSVDDCTVELSPLS